MKHGGFLILAGLSLASWVWAGDDGRLLERLRVNHAAMLASEQDFHDRQRRGDLNGIEAEDYAAYVARLHRLVAEDCAALAGAGVSLSPELGCPLLTPRLPAPATIDQAAEQTHDEQLAVLDAELLSGLGEFDEMLLREQERVRAATPMRDAATQGGGGAGETGDAEGSGAEQGESGERSEEQSESASGAGQGERTGSRAQRRRGGPGTPGNIPDGDDDDVVARQLREAAEKETSPALKAKLWEEYRKYKEGTR